MYNREQILQLLRTKKKEKKNKYAVSELGLFGSYASGDQHEHSDIDILVDFEKKLTAFTMFV